MQILLLSGDSLILKRLQLSLCFMFQALGSEKVNELRYRLLRIKWERIPDDASPAPGTPRGC